LKRLDGCLQDSPLDLRLRRFLGGADRFDRALHRSSRRANCEVEIFHFLNYCKYELIWVPLSHIGQYLELLSTRSRSTAVESTNFSSVSAFHRSFTWQLLSHSILNRWFCSRPLASESRRDILGLTGFAISEFLLSILVFSRSFSHNSYSHMSDSIFSCSPLACFGYSELYIVWISQDSDRLSRLVTTNSWSMTSWNGIVSSFKFPSPISVHYLRNKGTTLIDMRAFLCKWLFWQNRPRTMDFIDHQMIFSAKGGTWLHVIFVSQSGHCMLSDRDRPTSWMWEGMSRKPSFDPSPISRSAFRTLSSFQPFVNNIYFLSLLFGLLSDFLFLSCDLCAFPPDSPRGKIWQYNLGIAHFIGRSSFSSDERHALK
jgi:hypothetical protein